MKIISLPCSILIRIFSFTKIPEFRAFWICCQKHLTWMEPGVPYCLDILDYRISLNEVVHPFCLIGTTPLVWNEKSRKELIEILPSIEQHLDKVDEVVLYSSDSEWNPICHTLELYHKGKQIAGYSDYRNVYRAAHLLNSGTMGDRITFSGEFEDSEFLERRSIRFPVFHRTSEGLILEQKFISILAESKGRYSIKDFNEYAVRIVICDDQIEFWESLDDDDLSHSIICTIPKTDSMLEMFPVHCRLPIFTR